MANDSSDQRSVIYIHKQVDLPKTLKLSTLKTDRLQCILDNKFPDTLDTCVVDKTSHTLTIPFTVEQLLENEDHVYVGTMQRFLTKNTDDSQKNLNLNFKRRGYLMESHIIGCYQDSPLPLEFGMKATKQSIELTAMLAPQAVSDQTRQLLDNKYLTCLHVPVYVHKNTPVYAGMTAVMNAHPDHIVPLAKPMTVVNGGKFVMDVCDIYAGIDEQQLSNTICMYGDHRTGEFRVVTPETSLIGFFTKSFPNATFAYAEKDTIMNKDADYAMTIPKDVYNKIRENIITAANNLNNIFLVTLQGMGVWIKLSSSCANLDKIKELSQEEKTKPRVMRVKILFHMRYYQTIESAAYRRSSRKVWLSNIWPGMMVSKDGKVAPNTVPVINPYKPPTPTP